MPGSAVQVRSPLPFFPLYYSGKCKSAALALGTNRARKGRFCPVLAGKVGQILGSKKGAPFSAPFWSPWVLPPSPLHRHLRQARESAPEGFFYTILLMSGKWSNYPGLPDGLGVEQFLKVLGQGDAAFRDRLICLHFILQPKHFPVADEVKVFVRECAPFGHSCGGVL